MFNKKRTAERKTNKEAKLNNIVIRKNNILRCYNYKRFTSGHMKTPFKLLHRMQQRAHLVVFLKSEIQRFSR